MMEAQEAMHHSLLWGNTVSQEQEKEQAAEQLCEQYISQKVSGVFFAPVEFSANRFQSNHKIVAAFDRAGIPVVLLDRDLEPYPQRSRYDLVGIDNRRTGYLATEHLMKAGAKRVVFLCTTELCTDRGRSNCWLSRSTFVPKRRGQARLGLYRRCH